MKTLVLRAVLLVMLTAIANSAFSKRPFTEFAPVTDEMLQHPPRGDWLMWRRTLDSWGYSPLAQINRGNVGKLRMVWSREFGDGGLMESTPLVHNGVMYFATGDDIIQALDATNGHLLWEYRRALSPEKVLGSLITRSIAIWQDRLILVTKDSFIVAIDARSGALLWETPTGPIGRIHSSGPIIANGKAIVGGSCANIKLPGDANGCFVSAYDLKTGKELWRTYTIAQPGTDADKTWANVPYEKRRGVGTWITPSYDPKLNLIYIGTSETSPYSKFRFAPPGHYDDEFLYQTSTLAIDADTGEIKWHQQHFRDQYDMDHAYERFLIDTAVAPDPKEVDWINPKVTPGRLRHVVTGIFGKTGIFYAIDRKTGEFLWARNTVYQNLITSIDPLTGRATIPAEQIPTEVGQRHTLCPGWLGGKNWQAGAYSPLTGTIYFPEQNICMKAVEGAEDVENGGFQFAPGAKDNVGTIRAINVKTGRQLWQFDNRAAVTSLLTTGGGLVFGGDVNRQFRAFDQETGKILWEQTVPAQVGGFPISYEVGGQQYIAVPVGSFLTSAGLLRLTPELQPGTGGNAVVVFALPN
ncbi:hypothetical protein PI87_24255 [Ralstonia sp. A12]|uniref:pyrroloquinoline quinone-dependent dehydrogenase n=1 Tax=Ralstonia sp. A12 TaxID=1217052 RepID=UPI000575193F|nr:PQQ-binding-like beta-propeller repeat protein [Ralstonia sp. A12]KHK49870.1 hypothetical protein PI87_24255 [Ralstonia sp. A12]